MQSSGTQRVHSSRSLATDRRNSLPQSSRQKTDNEQNSPGSLIRRVSSLRLLLRIASPTETYYLKFEVVMALTKNSAV
jgi:hypothetical protein